MTALPQQKKMGWKILQIRRKKQKAAAAESKSLSPARSDASAATTSDCPISKDYSATSLGASLNRSRKPESDTPGRLSRWSHEVVRAKRQSSVTAVTRNPAKATATPKIQAPPAPKAEKSTTAPKKPVTYPKKQATASKNRGGNESRPPVDSFVVTISTHDAPLATSTAHASRRISKTTTSRPSSDNEDFSAVSKENTYQVEEKARVSVVAFTGIDEAPSTSSRTNGTPDAGAIQGPFATATTASQTHAKRQSCAFDSVVASTGIDEAPIEASSTNETTDAGTIQDPFAPSMDSQTHATGKSDAFDPWTVSIAESHTPDSAVEVTWDQFPSFPSNTALPKTKLERSVENVTAPKAVANLVASPTSEEKPKKSLGPHMPPADFSGEANRKLSHKLVVPELRSKRSLKPAPTGVEEAIKSLPLFGPISNEAKPESVLTELKLKPPPAVAPTQDEKAIHSLQLGRPRPIPSAEVGSKEVSVPLPEDVDEEEEVDEAKTTLMRVAISQKVKAGLWQEAQNATTAKKPAAETDLSIIKEASYPYSEKSILALRQAETNVSKLDSGCEPDDVAKTESLEEERPRDVQRGFGAESPLTEEEILKLLDISNDESFPVITTVKRPDNVASENMSTADRVVSEVPPQGEAHVSGAVQDVSRRSFEQIRGVVEEGEEKVSSPSLESGLLSTEVHPGAGLEEHSPDVPAEESAPAPSVSLDSLPSQPIVDEVDEVAPEIFSTPRIALTSRGTTRSRRLELYEETRLRRKALAAAVLQQSKHIELDDYNQNEAEKDDHCPSDEEFKKAEASLAPKDGRHNIRVKGRLSQSPRNVEEQDEGEIEAVVLFKKNKDSADSGCKEDATVSCTDVSSTMQGDTSWTDESDCDDASVTDEEGAVEDAVSDAEVSEDEDGYISEEPPEEGFWDALKADLSLTMFGMNGDYLMQHK